MADFSESIVTRVREERDDEERELPRRKTKENEPKPPHSYQNNSEFDSARADIAAQKLEKTMFRILKIFFGVILFGLVLVCTVFSKLTLVSLTDKLRSVTNLNKTQPNPSNYELDNELTLVPFLETDDIAVSLYWQLLLVIIIPNVIAFVRSLVFGVLGKTNINFPWPSWRALLVGLGASFFEVFAVSVFVFLVMAELPPDVSTLLLNGVFFCQIAVDIFSKAYMYKKSKEGYQPLSSQNKSSSTCSKVFSIGVKVIALLLQLGGLIAFIFTWSFYFMSFEVTGLEYLYRLRPIVALSLCLPFISLIWTNKVQEYMHECSQNSERKNVQREKTARYKSCFINSSIRIFLYPFVTYVIFRFCTSHQIDPWCLNSCDYGINFNGETWIIFVVQIFTTLFSYFFAWIACTMTLGISMGLALFLATPLSVSIYYIHVYAHIPNVSFFPPFSDVSVFNHAYPWVPVILSALWIGQLLAMGYYICIEKKSKILSKDWYMFLIPYYDSIFFEQQLLLNRQTKKYTIDSNSSNITTVTTVTAGKKAIIICTPMYHENADEMKSTLESIKRIAEYKEKENVDDIYESHIFFDGALVGEQLQMYGLQLLSLLEETLGVYPENGEKVRTPYGIRFMYELNKNMPFYIHFKNKCLVKPKKRWSQVMYMHYIVNRMKEGGDLHKTESGLPIEVFILATDADVNFTAESAVVLLDMLETNPLVGAVCARTHPKGSGPLYWYQVFDYAVGHWFQKPAEHLLGCVLCSPGCFSVFRCKAVEEVLETYSTVATNGMEFLMKDMGEDRWLCTLMIKQGWRLEYCAVSEDTTNCPPNFTEFYNQRRRWTASTIANLSLLISGIKSIPQKNDSISVLFIFFQALIFFSTVISPATVVLFIASGLQSAYKFSDEMVIFFITVLIIVSVLYGIVCLFTTPKTQIDVAKILSFVFAIVMIIVISGIFKNITISIFSDPQPVFLEAPNCTKFYRVNHTKAFEECEASARFLESLPNTLSTYHQFKLPISTSVVYLGLFTFTFLLAAILHITEFFSLFHGIWYLLALPSGYLLLLIYSAANLDSQSWGTREKGNERDKGLIGCLDYFKIFWKKLVLCCPCKRTDAPQLEVVEEEDRIPRRRSTIIEVDRQEMKESAKKWLKEEQECDESYISLFEENGYTDEFFFAEMTLKDFEAIGIDKLGFRLRLSSAVRALPTLPLNVDVPHNVGSWLDQLKMSQYKPLFEAEGFSKAKDVENLKRLTREDLQAMGITQRAHLERLMRGLHFLLYPSEVEHKIALTKVMIQEMETQELEAEEEGSDKDKKEGKELTKNRAKTERKLWNDLIANCLKPIPEQLTSVDEVKKSLQSLRNSSLIALFLVNVMWIIVLFTVKFPRLELYGFDARAFQLLFLAVYGFIIIVQCIAMICHRGITLMHYFGRIKLKEDKKNAKKNSLITTENSINVNSWTSEC